MSLYAFYLIKDDKGYPIPERLYAIALDKYSKKLFEELRNMKIFHTKKFKDKKEFFQCNGKHMQDIFSRYVLSLVSLQTINDFGKMMKIDILATWDEEEKTVLYHDRITDKILSSSLPPIDIFKKKYRKDLEILGYEEFFQMSIINNVFINRYGESAVDDEVKRLNESYRFDVDEFKVFMKLYGYTMKGG